MQTGPSQISCVARSQIGRARAVWMQVGRGRNALEAAWRGRCIGRVPGRCDGDGHGNGDGARLGSTSCTAQGAPTTTTAHSGGAVDSRSRTETEGCICRLLAATCPASAIEACGATEAGGAANGLGGNTGGQGAAVPSLLSPALPSSSTPP
jgi:hypothetical protein